MENSRRHTFKKVMLYLLFLVFSLFSTESALCYPLSFTDDQGRSVTIARRPKNVVSLIPSVTETILKLDAGDCLSGITYRSMHPEEAVEKTIVGGFLSPSIEKIRSLKPEVIFYSGLQKEVIQAFRNSDIVMISLQTASLADSFADISLLGRIFDREAEAGRIIDDIRRDLDLIARKVAKIPAAKRKRVMRLMGRDQIMTPGRDSFQNEIIQAAGGIPPDFGKKGAIVPVSRHEWERFDPQVVYGCGGDQAAARAYFDRPGWRDAAAVRNGKIFYFPCTLTCRAATNTGYFVSWLAATIYPEEFAQSENRVLEEKVFETRELEIDLDYVQAARIAYSHIYDFKNKTLIVEFDRPLSLISTLEGPRSGITTVGNHYSPPPCWGITHGGRLETVQKPVYRVIGKSAVDASFLFTGADMDNLSIQRKEFKDMAVVALVTAGVRGNALRMGKDTGDYYEPGTINIILLPNMALSPRAMTRAIVSATEGKSAALLDMDVRSSYQPRRYRATGTGTDNIIVVQGSGTALENAGGHSKLGELIGKAVYAGVQDAIHRQNALTLRRNVFHRLQERRIAVRELIPEKMCTDRKTRTRIAAAVEAALLDPRWADFVESAMVLSDDFGKGLFEDLTAHRMLCRQTAEAVAGRTIVDMQNFLDDQGLPVVLEMTLNALLNGVYHQTRWQ